MGLFEEAKNEDLLSALAGKGAAQVLMEQYGSLTPLAQASIEELQQVKGVGRSKAGAIKQRSYWRSGWRRKPSPRHR